MSPLPLWPAAKLAEALHALAGQGESVGESPAAPPPAPDADALDLFIRQSALRLGLECTPIALEYAAFERRMRFTGPAILRLPEGSFLVLLPGGAILGPDLTARRIPAQTLRAAVFANLEAPAAEKLDRGLEASGLPPRRRSKVRPAVLRELLAGAEPVTGWQLHQRPGASFFRLARAAGLTGSLAALAVAHLAQYLLWIAAWWLIGKAVLEGRIDSGALWGWALVLLTSVPLRVLTTWLQGRISIGAGGLLKERLLYGALRLDTEQTRHQGVGQLLGRVIESDALESLALSGGFLALVAILELLVASAVLSLGAGGVLHAAVFAAWVLITLLSGWRYFRRAADWTAARLRMTDDLVERMVGHRTPPPRPRCAARAPGSKGSTDRQCIPPLPRSRPGTRPLRSARATVPRCLRLPRAVPGLPTARSSG